MNITHDLAHRLAHITSWIKEAILYTLTVESKPHPLHQQLANVRQILLPNVTAPAFADMYAQTIVYSLFAARMAVADTQSFTRFDAVSSIPATSPLVCSMLQDIADPDLDTRIACLVDECASLLKATPLTTIRAEFNKTLCQSDPIVHFYEIYLSVYNPHERERCGVYYTPEPVVSYIVHAVDHLLRTRLNTSDGFADDQTIILDPATGTATFLHTVVQRICEARRMLNNLEQWNNYVAHHLLPRLFGIELLMTPYIVAQLKLGYLLQQTGYTFQCDDHVQLFLANAPHEAAQQHEQQQCSTETLPPQDITAVPAHHLHQLFNPADAKTLVVLGNPPYAATSANKDTLDDAIRTHYYPCDAIKEHNLKLLLDDYVKFFRLGQHYIEQAETGILAFVTNHAYLNSPTFRRMRQSLMQTFTTIYILNLHGNVRQKETAPDGTKDENVFDIQQGVAIGLFVKEPSPRQSQQACTIFYADLWGPRFSNADKQGKYDWLTSHSIATTDWREITPRPPFYLFVPTDASVQAVYERGWNITDIFPIMTSGIKTHRDHFVVAFDRTVLEQRIAEFRDLTIPDDIIRERYNLNDTQAWSLYIARQTLASDEHWQSYITPVLYRPFDTRWLYYHPSLVDRPRVASMHHMHTYANIGLVTVRQVAEPDFNHVLVTDSIVDCRVTLSNKGTAYLFPLYRYESGEPVANLSADFISDVEARYQVQVLPTGQGNLDTTIGVEDIFHYIYALLHSPAYRQRYAECLRRDFPHVPLVSSPLRFATLARKGAELVGLHLLREHMQGDSEQGITLNGAGVIQRLRYQAEQQQLIIGKNSWLSGIEPVLWHTYIGGYQPLHKWFKERKGSTLNATDVQHISHISHVLYETRRIMQEIDTIIPVVPTDT